MSSGTQSPCLVDPFSQWAIFSLCHFFLCLFFRCHFFRLPTVTPICTGVGTGGGGQGGHVPPPTFQSGRQRYVCAPPLSDPEFRDVPPHILSRSYAVDMVYLVNIFAIIYLFMAMLDNGVLLPLGACRLWGLNKYAQESACGCQMVVTDKRFLLVPVDRPHWKFRGRIGSK